MPAPATRVVRRPAFVVRAPDPNNRGRWISVGYAWERRNGDEGYSIKLNSIPVGNWDGALVLLPPLRDEEAPDFDPETGEVR
jgi:hypothetical protein